MKKYYQPEIETAPREKILEIQNEKIVKQVRHVWDNVPYYRRHYYCESTFISSIFFPILVCHLESNEECRH